MLKINFRLFYTPTNVQQTNQLIVDHAAHLEMKEENLEMRMTGK